MRNKPGPRTKDLRQFGAGFGAQGAAGDPKPQMFKLGVALLSLVSLGACVEIVGMDNPVLVDKLEGSSDSAGSSSSGEATTSSGMGGNSITTSSGVSSSSSSSSGATGWANWPMPNPPSANLPNPAAYTVDNGADIVTDNLTKLVWQRTVNAGTFTWSEALAHCDQLIHAGFDDWRLPSRIELVSIVDYTKAKPSIAGATFPNTPSGDFWSASPSSSLADAWSVRFDYGGTHRIAMTTSGRVRCVR